MTALLDTTATVTTPTLAELIAGTNAAWDAFGDINRAMEGQGPEVEAASAAHMAAVAALREYKPTTLRELALKACALGSDAGNGEVEQAKNFDVIADDARWLDMQPPAVVPEPWPAAGFLAWDREVMELRALINGDQWTTDEEVQPAIERQAELENLIRSTRSTEPAALAVKLRALTRYTNFDAQWFGTYSDERMVGDLTDDLMSLAQADAVLLALGAEFERRWALERAMEEEKRTDEEFDAATAYTWEIADQIEATPFQTVAGARVWARVIIWASGTETDFRKEAAAARCTMERVSAKLVLALCDKAVPPPSPDARLIEVTQAFEDHTLERRGRQYDPVLDARGGRDDQLYHEALCTRAQTLQGLIGKARIANLHTALVTPIVDLDMDEALRMDIMFDLMALGGQDVRPPQPPHEFDPPRGERPDAPAADAAGCPVAAMMEPMTAALAAEAEETVYGTPEAQAITSRAIAFETAVTQIDATSPEGAVFQLVRAMVESHTAYDNAGSDLGEFCLRKAHLLQARAIRTLGTLLGVDPLTIGGESLQVYYERHLVPGGGLPANPHAMAAE